VQAEQAALQSITALYDVLVQAWQVSLMHLKEPSPCSLLLMQLSSLTRKKTDSGDAMQAEMKTRPAQVFIHSLARCAHLCQLFAFPAGHYMSLVVSDAVKVECCALFAKGQCHLWIAKSF